MPGVLEDVLIHRPDPSPGTGPFGRSVVTGRPGADQGHVGSARVAMPARATTGGEPPRRPLRVVLVPRPASALR